MKKKAELGILVISLILTFTVSFLIQSTVKKTDTLRLKSNAEKIKNTMAFRLDKYIWTVKSMRAMFASSSEVTAADFRTFIAQSRLDTDFRGIKAYVYIRRVKEAEMTEYRQKLASDLTLGGNLDKLSPTLPQGKSEYLVIDYLVLPDGETPSELGREVGADTVLSQAFQRSVEIAEPVASGQLTSILSNQKGEGFWIVMPVFKQGANLNTTEARQEAIQGFVVSALTYQEMAEAVFESENFSQVNLKITDRSGVPIYDSGTQADDAESVWKTSVMVAGREWQLDFTQADTKGLYDWEHQVPFYVLGGGIAISILLFSIVGSLKREAEKSEKLAKGEATLASSVESFPRGFVIVDAKGQIVLANKVLSRILATREEQWTLKKMEAKLGLDGELSVAYYHSLETKKTYDPPEFLLGKLWLKLYMAPIFIKGPGTDVIGVIITLDDITEQKAVERSKDEFFSIASHELRTPLTTIRGNADMIQDFYADKVKDSEFKEMIADISESSTRLIEIVNDFLHMSRLEQGKIEFKIASVDLNELIPIALKEYQVTGSRRKIALEWEAPKTKLPKVSADSDRVRQILINLVGNGIKFTEEGSVVIRAETVPGKVIVYVQDTGRGILPENQGLLFRKFQQAGSSLLTRDTTKGTGLGLYISKLLVEGMGGEIWLSDSKPKKGSTFAFSLPIVRR